MEPLRLLLKTVPVDVALVCSAHALGCQLGLIMEDVGKRGQDGIAPLVA